MLHKIFVYLLTPNGLNQRLNKQVSKNADKVKSMEQELNAIADNNVWELVPLPLRRSQLVSNGFIVSSSILMVLSKGSRLALQKDGPRI